MNVESLLRFPFVEQKDSRNSSRCDECQHTAKPTLAVLGSDIRWCPVCGTLIGPDGEEERPTYTERITR